MDFESELGKWILNEGGSCHEIFFSEEDEGGVVGVEGILVVEAGAFLLGSFVEKSVVFIWEMEQLWLR